MIWLAIVLIEFNGPEGRSIMINPEQVTHLIQPMKEDKGQYFTDEANCIIHLTDGTHLTATFNCVEVKRLLEEKVK